MNQSLLKEAKQYLLTTTGIVIYINGVLAVVALLRDIMLAHYLGTSSIADGLLLAFFLPDTIGNNIFSASIGVVSVPVLASILVGGSRARFQRTVRNIVLAVLTISAVIILGFLIFRYEIIAGLGRGLTEQIILLSLELFLIVLPTMFFFPLVNVGSAVLQVFNRFNIPALAPIVFNLVFFLGAFLAFWFTLPVDVGVYVIALSITGGVLAMTILVWTSIFRYRRLEGLIIEEKKVIASEEKDFLFQDFLRLFLPYIFILVVTQSVYYVERYLASLQEVGSIAGLNYAFRLAQFPIWVFVTAIAAVSLPSMAKSWRMGYTEQLQTTFYNALRIFLLLVTPIAIILNILRVPVVAILLQRGAFDSSSLRITTGILAGYSLAIIGQGLVVLGTRLFLALGKLFYPLLVVLLSTLINVISDFYLVKIIGSPGLGYGAAIGALCNTVLILWLISKELGTGFTQKLPELLKIILCNIPLLLVNMCCYYFWQLLPQEKGVGLLLLYICIVVIVNIGVYLYSLTRFKVIQDKNSKEGERIA